MATITATENPMSVVAADTNDNILMFEENELIGSPLATAFITVVTGTFKFNVGGLATQANAASYTVGDVVPPIPFKPGVGFHFKANAISDAFKVSAI